MDALSLYAFDILLWSATDKGKKGIANNEDSFLHNLAQAMLDKDVKWPSLINEKQNILNQAFNEYELRNNPTPELIEIMKYLITYVKYSSYHEHWSETPINFLLSQLRDLHGYRIFLTIAFGEKIAYKMNQLQSDTVKQLEELGNKMLQRIE